MTFNNSGTIAAGIINQVEGNQYNNGGQQGVAMSIAAARDAAVDLRRALAVRPARTSDAAEINAHLDEIEGDIRAPDPDKRRVAHSLEQLTRLLSSIGALMKESGAVIRPLQTLAHWLGPFGVPILHLLPFA